MKKPIEKKTEDMAREIARENGMSESLWEMFLQEAHERVFSKKEIL